MSDWMEQALCRQIADWFHLNDFEQVSVCPNCPVRAQCFEFGVQQLSTFNPNDTCVYGALPIDVVREKRRRVGVAA